MSSKNISDIQLSSMFLRSTRNLSLYAPSLVQLEIGKTQTR